MNRLALGTAQFGLDYGVAGGSRLTDAEAAAVLEVGRAAGMDTIDTAVGYGDAEQRLGGLGVRSWRVISKLGAVPDDVEEPGQWLAAQVRASCRRLGIAQLDGVLLHRPQQLAGRRGERIYRGLRGLRETGLARRIGISIYSPDELDATPYRMDIVQAPLNVVDRRLVTSGWLAKLAAQGVDVHARSILLQGLLGMNEASRPARFARWTPLWRRWHAWLEETALSPIEACVRFALSFAAVGRIVVGVDSASHLRQLLAAAAGPLPPVPADLASADVDLVNPSRWSLL